MYIKGKVTAQGASLGLGSASIRHGWSGSLVRAKTALPAQHDDPTVARLFATSACGITSGTLYGSLRRLASGKVKVCPFQRSSSRHSAAKLRRDAGESISGSVSRLEPRRYDNPPLPTPHEGQEGQGLEEKVAGARILTKTSHRSLRTLWLRYVVRPSTNYMALKARLGE